MLQAVAMQGIQTLLLPGTFWQRPFLAMPNLGLLAAALPDWRGPLVRDLQLQLQRMIDPTCDFAPATGHMFGGVHIGGDAAGYVQYWNWAGAVPSRPWGEAMQSLYGFGKDVRLPIIDPMGSPQDYERRTDNVPETIASLDTYGMIK
jgi:hypothetical protein